MLCLFYDCTSVYVICLIVLSPYTCFLGYMYTCASIPYLFFIYKYDKTIIGDSVRYDLGNFLIVSNVPIVYISILYFHVTLLAYNTYRVQVDCVHPYCTISI